MSFCVKSTPIRTIDFISPADVTRHDRMVALVERMWGTWTIRSANAMNESEDTRLTSISKARTLDEIADFGIRTVWPITGTKRTKSSLRSEPSADTV